MADEPITKDWREILPENVKFSDSLGKFKDIPSLATSYLELERKLGSRIGLPNESSKPEEWATYFKHWGRPETDSGYEYPELPKELFIDDGFKQSLNRMAHDLGLNKGQFKKLVEWGAGRSMEALQQQAQESEKTKGILQKEWGFRYKDNYEKSMRALGFLVGYKADHPFLKYLESSAVGDDPNFLKMLFDLHERLGEDAFEDTKATTQTQLQKSDAIRKINEIRSDDKHPYFNEYDARHKDAVIEMNKLYEIAYA